MSEARRGEAIEMTLHPCKKPEHGGGEAFDGLIDQDLGPRVTHLQNKEDPRDPGDP